MVISVELLAMRRLGVPWKPIHSLLDTLQKMKHYIRTAHRDSCGYYSGSLLYPLQSGGQGNAAAGPMWMAISIVLLSIMSMLPINSTIVMALLL